MTTVREIMSDSPIIVDVGMGVVDIAKILEAEGIGGVIVCNDDRRLQGMITDRDIAVQVVGSGRDPVNTVADDLLDAREVVTIGADDSIQEAAKTMKEHAVRRLPVIDGDQVIGILTQADLARNADEEMVGEVIEAISSARDNTARG